MSGRIPQQFIDDLITRIDIVDIIDTYVPLRKGGRDYMARCPFHDEKTPSFTVSQEKQFYHCFGCGAHGTAIGFLMEYEHLDFVDAVQDLASRAGLEVPHSEQGPAQQVASTTAFYDLLQQVTDFYRGQLKEHPRGKQAIEYLRKRGLKGEIAAEFSLGYAPPGWNNLQQSLGKDKSLEEKLTATGMLIKKDNGKHYDRFRDRIMFPIRDPRGRVIGFGGRVLGDDTPKYLNSPETPIFHKGRGLYGLYEARKALRHVARLLVVEGYMDVIMLAQHGINYAVATLGTATTHEHLERMFRIAPEIVFCFDGDRAGREAAWRALENTLPVMREGRQARFMFLPEGEDPDSLIQQEKYEKFERRIADSFSLSAYLYEQLSNKVDMSSIDGRARLVELARPLLSKLPQGVFKHMMMTHLAEIAQMNPGTLDGLLGKDTVGLQKMTLKKSKPLKHQPPSLIRKAVIMLLQDPSLARLADNSQQLGNPGEKGIALLTRMLELLSEHPHLNTGALLEHWRGTEEGRYLNILAQQENLVSAGDMDKEFSDTLRCLHQQYLKQRLEYLSNKAYKDLGADEKMEIKQLLIKSPVN